MGRVRAVGDVLVDGFLLPDSSPVSLSRKEQKENFGRRIIGNIIRGALRERLASLRLQLHRTCLEGAAGLDVVAEGLWLRLFPHIGTRECVLVGQVPARSGVIQKDRLFRNAVTFIV